MAVTSPTACHASGEGLGHLRSTVLYVQVTRTVHDRTQELGDLGGVWTPVRTRSEWFYMYMSLFRSKIAESSDTSDYANEILVYNNNKKKNRQQAETTLTRSQGNRLKPEFWKKKRASG